MSKFGDEKAIDAEKKLANMEKSREDLAEFGGTVKVKFDYNVVFDVDDTESVSLELTKEDIEEAGGIDEAVEEKLYTWLEGLCSSDFRGAPSETEVTDFSVGYATVAAVDTKTVEMFEGEDEKDKEKT